MSGKLDQSLDDIVKTNRVNRPRKTARRTKTAATTTGGITKNGKANKATRPTKTAQAVVPVGPASGESKILVSGLPSDITEVQIKEYFAKTIGPVKKVFLTYGPNGQSRGISTIVFNKPESAHNAATQLNGVKVDNRPMKVEVILGANQAPAPAPRKALGERIAQQTRNNAKAKPKAVTANGKPAATNGKTGARPGRRNAKGRTNRQPKSLDELDAEMTDYFVAKPDENAPAANGAASGEVAMDDQIM